MFPQGEVVRNKEDVSLVLDKAELFGTRQIIGVD